jgi:hypothetical protein
MKNQFKYFYNIDTFFLKPPTNINNTIKNIKKHLNFNNEIIKILGEKKISSIKKSLNHLSNPNFNGYDKYFEVDFIELLNLTWRFVQHYEPECMCLFFESLNNIENIKHNHTKTYRIYNFYKVHMLDKDDLFIMNLI